MMPERAQIQFLLDEHYPGWLAEDLAADGIDAVALTAHRPGLRGVDDQRVLEAAVAEHRVVVTEDVSTFGLAATLVSYQTHSSPDTGPCRRPCEPGAVTPVTATRLGKDRAEFSCSHVHTGMRAAFRRVRPGPQPQRKCHTTRYGTTRTDQPIPSATSPMPTSPIMPQSYPRTVMLNRDRRCNDAMTVAASARCPELRVGRFRVVYVIDGDLITVERVDRISRRPASRAFNITQAATGNGSCSRC
jgi:hypothetical protein